MSNCRQIVLALDAYHQQHGHYPPAFIADGIPLHSWRVLILPFIEERQLYDEYCFDEPWNGQNNIKLIHQMPSLFRCPGHGHGRSKNAGDGYTNYQLIVGPETVFPGCETTSESDISDGKSQTVLVVDVNSHSVEWIRPVDLQSKTFVAMMHDPKHVSNHSARMTIAGFADSHVQAIFPHMSETSLMAMTTLAMTDQIEMDD